MINEYLSFLEIKLTKNNMSNNQIISREDIEKLKPIVDKLEDNAIREISYTDTMDMAMQELSEMNIDNIPSWWFNEFDNIFWLLMRWQVYVVWWVTGTGKSTFLNQICQNISEQWFRVSLYTLEDRIQTVRQTQLYFTVNKLRKKNSEIMIPKWEFMAGMHNSDKYMWEARLILEKKYKNIVTLKHNWFVTIKIIEEMIKEAAKAWSKVIALDHLHYFDTTENVASDRHDLVIKDIMHRINHLARELNITIIIVAHYKKLAQWQKPSLNDFSGSISIAQVANGIIHIYRDKWDEFEPNKTEFIVDKNRDMWITKTIQWTFNLSTYEYEFAKSQLAEWRKKIF